MYGSVVLADTYHAVHDLDGTWTLLTSGLKTQAMNKATVQVDRLVYAGRKESINQTEQFPRIVFDGRKTYYFDLDESGGIVVPEKVLHATYEQAKFLMDTRTNQTICALKMGVAVQSQGRTSQTVDKDLMPMNTKTGLSREVEQLLQPFLIVGY